MNEKFFDLKKEKQDRMMNAALKIFGENGYKRASTDEIVAAAGISKGLLFHYFTSKLGLYTFVYEYSVRFLSLEMSSFIDKKETNYFRLMMQKEKALCQIMRNYPYMQLFLDRTMSENVFEAMEATEAQKEALLELNRSILAQADFSKLRPGAVPEKLQKMVDYTMHALMEERFRDGSFQPDMLYEEACQYLSMMEKLSIQQ